MIIVYVPSGIKHGCYLGKCREDRTISLKNYSIVVAVNELLILLVLKAFVFDRRLLFQS